MESETVETEELGTIDYPAIESYNTYLVYADGSKVQVGADRVKVEEGHLNFYTVEEETTIYRSFLGLARSEVTREVETLVASFPPGLWSGFGLVADDDCGLLFPG